MWMSGEAHVDAVRSATHHRRTFGREKELNDGKKTGESGIRGIGGHHGRGWASGRGLHVRAPPYDDWAATDGAAGRINLDEVQEAFKKSESATEFERRVNEIYEGDGLVLIRSSQDGDRLTLEGFEDLSKNGAIDDVSDDLLFTIVKEGDNKELRGHGANGYYRRPFGGGDLLFTYLILSSFGGPYGYYTRPGRIGTLNRQRATYRASPTYRSQVTKNTNYFKSQSKFAGSSYNNASRNLSQGRKTYQSSQKQTGAFKSSKTGVRSSWGSESSGGGFRGGGGGQVIIGPPQH